MAAYRHWRSILRWILSAHILVLSSGFLKLSTQNHLFQRKLISRIKNAYPHPRRMITRFSYEGRGERRESGETTEINKLLTLLNDAVQKDDFMKAQFIKNKIKFMKKKSQSPKVFSEWIALGINKWISHRLKFLGYRFATSCQTNTISSWIKVLNITQSEMNQYGASILGGKIETYFQNDLLIRAPTGSGKTLAFLASTLSLLSPKLYERERKIESMLDEAVESEENRRNKDFSVVERAEIMSVYLSASIVMSDSNPEKDEEKDIEGKGIKILHDENWNEEEEEEYKRMSESNHDVNDDDVNDEMTPNDSMSEEEKREQEIKSKNHDEKHGVEIEYHRKPLLYIIAPSRELGAQIASVLYQVVGGETANTPSSPLSISYEDYQIQQNQKKLNQKQKELYQQQFPERFNEQDQKKKISLEGVHDDWDNLKYAGPQGLTTVAFLADSNVKDSKFLDCVDFAVGTPALTAKLYREKPEFFNDVQVMVMDEADLILASMSQHGHANDVKSLTELLRTRDPSQRRHIFVGASLGSDALRFALSSSFLNANQSVIATATTKCQLNGQPLEMSKKNKKIEKEISSSAMKESFESLLDQERLVPTGLVHRIAAVSPSYSKAALVQLIRNDFKIFKSKQKECRELEKKNENKQEIVNEGGGTLPEELDKENDVEHFENEMLNTPIDLNRVENHQKEEEEEEEVGASHHQASQSSQETSVGRGGSVMEAEVRSSRKDGSVDVEEVNNSFSQKTNDEQNPPKDNKEEDTIMNKTNSISDVELNHFNHKEEEVDEEGDNDFMGDDDDDYNELEKSLGIHHKFNPNFIMNKTFDTFDHLSQEQKDMIFNSSSSSSSSKYTIISEQEIIQPTSEDEVLKNKGGLDHNNSIENHFEDMASNVNADDIDTLTKSFEQNKMNHIDDKDMKQYNEKENNKEDLEEVHEQEEEEEAKDVTVVNSHHNIEDENKSGHDLKERTSEESITDIIDRFDPSANTSEEMLTQVLEKLTTNSSSSTGSLFSELKSQNLKKQFEDYVKDVLIRPRAVIFMENEATVNTMLPILTDAFWSQHKLTVLLPNGNENPLDVMGDFAAATPVRNEYMATQDPKLRSQFDKDVEEDNVWSEAFAPTILLTTPSAGRGLDFVNLTHVYNFNIFNHSSHTSPIHNMFDEQPKSIDDDVDDDVNKQEVGITIDMKAEYAHQAGRLGRLGYRGFPGVITSIVPPKFNESMFQLANLFAKENDDVGDEDDVGNSSLNNRVVMLSPKEYSLPLPQEGNTKESEIQLHELLHLIDDDDDDDEDEEREEEGREPTSLNKDEAAPQMNENENDDLPNQTDSIKDDHFFDGIENFTSTPEIDLKREQFLKELGNLAKMTSKRQTLSKMENYVKKMENPNVDYEYEFEYEDEDADNNFELFDFANENFNFDNIINEKYKKKFDFEEEEEHKKEEKVKHVKKNKEEEKEEKNVLDDDDDDDVKERKQEQTNNNEDINEKKKRYEEKNAEIDKFVLPPMPQEHMDGTNQKIYRKHVKSWRKIMTAFNHAKKQFNENQTTSSRDDVPFNVDADDVPYNVDADLE